MRHSSVIPAEALNQHIAILGKTGSGKTFAAKGIVEGLIRANRQTCIIDPTGAWWGLRLAADGKGKGLDVVLLGGEHADIPLAERSGAAVARLVTEQGASVVIDTSGFTVGEYTRWFIDFAGTLYTTVREPLHLVIDEAHYFMPQGRVPDVDAGKMLHAGNRLMSGGRSRGIRGILITQRPAKLHKDSLTCADTLVAMRVIAPQDRSAIKEWVDGCGNPTDGKSVLDSLAQLERGEGWVWYPEGKYLERTRFPAITTYDSSAAPKHGAKSAPKVGEIDLGEVKKALADAVKEAEANDPKLLRKRIAELEKTVRERPAETKVVKEIERVEVPVLNNGLLDRTDKLAAVMQAAVDKMAGEVTELRRLIAPAFSQTSKVYHGDKGGTGIGAPKSVHSIGIHGHQQRQTPNREAKARPAAIAQRSAPTLPEGINGKLPSGEREILVTLKQRSGVPLAVRQLVTWTGQAERTVQNNLSKLRARGFIVGSGDSVSITDPGSDFIGNDFSPLPSGQELIQHYQRTLPSGESAILASLVDIYPESMSVPAIAEQTGQAERTVQNNLSRLRSRSLAVGSGQAVRASEDLF